MQVSVVSGQLRSSAILERSSEVLDCQDAAVTPRDLSKRLGVAVGEVSEGYARNFLEPRFRQCCEWRSTRAIKRSSRGNALCRWALNAFGISLSRGDNERHKSPSRGCGARQTCSASVQPTAATRGDSPTWRAVDPATCAITAR